MLRGPHGLKELGLRGSMDRKAWVQKHDGHDLRVMRLEMHALALIEGMREEDEVLPNYDENTGRARPKPSGKKVLRPSGQKVEDVSAKSSPADLILCASCGIMALDTAPTITTKGE